MKFLKKILATGMLLIAVNVYTNAQNILNRNISIRVNNQRLDNVLEIISNKGDFYFSYNSNLIKKDSLVTLSVSNKTVKEVLDLLFGAGYEFKESGNYIIIRRTTVNASVTGQAISDDKIYIVSGYVVDNETGDKLSNASVYEKKLLVSALTNDDGYFKLNLKAKSNATMLTISKESYDDTTIRIRPGYNQQITVTIMPEQMTQSIITISPQDFYAPDSLKLRLVTDSAITDYVYVKRDSVRLDKTAAAIFLLSYKQKIISLNLSKYFTERPFQVSFTPGLSTHGKLSSQVINNFSLNILGGYSGGLNGAEIGGLFNLDKKDVTGAQVGGIFNLTGGNVAGVQVGGIDNTVMNSVEGVQIAGINNYAKGKINGVQIAGIYNHTSNTMSGAQIAGISNFSNKKANGVQISGIGNVAAQEMRGVQVAGIFNYTKVLKGLQIGLINVADSSAGCSIGLINIVAKGGYHKLSFYANETMNANVAIKTGNANLYSILMGGINISDSSKVYSAGFGLGHDMIMSNHLALSAEVSSQYLYLGDWDYTNILSKFSLHLNVKLAKNIRIFAGPTFNAYFSNQQIAMSGYKATIPSSGYHTFDLGTNNKDWRGWVGWNAGITLF